MARTNDGAHALLLSSKGTILLVIKGALYADKGNAGKISMFGGGIDEGESVMEALKRELVEELALDISDKTVEPLNVYRKTLEQDGIDAEVHVFTVAKVDAASVVIQKEEAGAEVLDFNEAIVEGTPEELLSNPALTRVTRLALEDFIKRNS